MKKPNLKNMNKIIAELHLPGKKKIESEKHEEGTQSTASQAERTVRKKRPEGQQPEKKASRQQSGRPVEESVDTRSEGKRRKRPSVTAAEKKDLERQEIRKARLEARKKEAFRKKVMLGAGAAVLILLCIVLIACPGKKNQETVNTEAETVGEEIPSGPVSTETVRHFSFRMLISDEMAGDNSVLTVNQFRQILQQLYEANYILVDFYSIAGVEEKEDGSTVFTGAELELPPGKIPFVLSQRDVSYSLDRVGKGYASRLVLGDGNVLTNEYQRADGAILRGAYDVVPILEEFIAEHPDFSYNNARGVLGLTGYNGILGYRTSEMLGHTLEEGNPYAVYGVFDVNAEMEACRPVVDVLKQSGWHLASYGNNYCSFGAEYPMVIADIDTWRANVYDLIGGTDIQIFPCGTDIGGWSEYKEDNERYQYLKKQGFNYFCIEDKDNPYWLQIRPGYVRQGIKEIDCYDDFAAIMAAE